MTAHATAPGQWRLLAAALVAWAATAAVILVPGSAVWLLLSVAGVGSALGIVALRRGTGWRVAFRLVAIACALIALLGARITVEESVRTHPAWSSAAENGNPVATEARLVGFPQSAASEFDERTWVRAEALEGAARLPVVLFIDGAPRPGWGPGTRLDIVGVPKVTAPGEGAAFAVRVTAVSATHQAELDAPFGERIQARAGELAAALRWGLRVASAAVPGAELVPGFAVGDTGLVSEELDQAMLASSLTHLTAVSGANCALVTGAAMWGAARLGAGRRLRIAAAACGLLAFLAIVGPDASVQRAAVMAAVLLATNFGGKRAATLPALGAAIVTLLLVDPWQALQPGFALSVAATAGILTLATPFAAWLQRRARLPRILSLPVGVALAAQLACGPFLLLLQPGIPAVGVLANVIAAPAAPLGTGLGLGAALLIPLSADLGHLAVLAASLPSRWIAATAEVAAALPLARWYWPDGWLGAGLLAACQAGPWLAWAIRRGYIALPRVGPAPRRLPWQPASAPPRPVRIVQAIAVNASIGVFVAVSCVTPLGERLGTPTGWAVVACDVGQGDALLVRDPGAPGVTTLIDTGDEPELLEACLARFGVDRIALLVLSHDDRDHVGALASIASRVDAALIAPPTREQLGAERQVVRELAAAGVPTTVGEAGMAGTAGRTGEGRSTADAGVRWEVLAPVGARVPADTNAASLVLRIAAGKSSVLLLGDTGFEQQQELIARGASVSADVLKVSHHGSRDQDQRLPTVVGAAWALVSVGEGNGYGHPSPETLGALERAGARTLRTDMHGSIALSPASDGRLLAWTERVPGDDVGGHP